MQENLTIVKYIQNMCKGHSFKVVPWIFQHSTTTKTKEYIIASVKQGKSNLSGIKFPIK